MSLKRKVKNVAKKGGSVLKSVAKYMSPVNQAKAVLPRSKAQRTAAVKGGSTGALKAGAIGALAGAAVGVIGAKLYDKVRGARASAGGVRHRRSRSVPKVVAKWVNRITRRRKNEEKAIKKLIGSDGSKVIKRPRRSYGFTPGVITAQEAREAMRQ